MCFTPKYPLFHKFLVEQPAIVFLNSEGLLKAKYYPLLNSQDLEYRQGAGIQLIFAKWVTAEQLQNSCSEGTKYPIAAS